MKLEPTTATSTISFIGDNVHKTMAAHHDMVKSIWRLCFDLTDATIKVHISPRDVDAQPLHWNVYISSPIGHRSVVAMQRRPGAPITFANE